MSEMFADDAPRAAIIDGLREEAATLRQYPDPKFADVIHKKAEALELKAPEGKWFLASWSNFTGHNEGIARTVSRGAPKTTHGAKVGYGLDEVSLASRANRPYIDEFYAFVQARRDPSEPRQEEAAKGNAAFNQAVFDQIGTFYVDQESSRVYANVPVASGFNCIMAPSRSTSIASLREAGYTQAHEPLFGILGGNQIPVEPILGTNSHQTRIWTESSAYQEVEAYWNSLPDPDVLAALSGVATYAQVDRF